MAHPKGLLIERAQKLGLERPEFDTAKTGPEHEPSFITDVVSNGEVIGTGQGKSKREAEKAAAEEALATLESRRSGDRGRSGGDHAGRNSPAPGTPSGAASEEDEMDEEPTTEEFSGPWPMFDDLLASVLTVAERRVSADLRGEAARTAIRDFSLTLYKELLSNLGEVVEEDEEDEED